MVDLVAYVSGDITTTTEILSQVVLVVNSADFSDAILLSMMAGFMVSLFSGLLSKGEFSMMGFFVPILLYVLGIQPTATLIIENDRTGALSSIDDVPIAIAGPISLITLTGHNISEMMETSLGLADRRITTDNSVLVSVRAPLSYREILTQSEVLGSASQVAVEDVDVLLDSRNYIKECIAPTVGKGLKSTSEMYGAAMDTGLDPGVLSSYRVKKHSGGMDTCSGLFEDLQTAMASDAFLDSLEDVLNDQYGRYMGDVDIGPSYRASLTAMVTDEAEYVQGIIWLHAIDAGIKMYKGQGGAESSNAALNDALTHRLANNRGQAAIVFETMGSTIGFIEAWSFGIMPLMLLILVFGNMGFKLASKYFWLLIWIQLWHPTILIVVDWLESSARNISVNDIGTLNAAQAFLTHSLRLEDIGYMMLSMATMLSMFLIYGTSAIFGTGLQRAMSGGDYYDEKKVYADSLSRAPDFTQKGSFEATKAGGVVATSAASAFGNVTFSNALNNAAGVTETQLEQASRAAVLASGKTQTSSEHAGHTSQTGNNLSTSEGYDVGTSTAKSLNNEALIRNSAGSMSSNAEQEVNSFGRNAGVTGSVAARTPFGGGSDHGAAPFGGSVSAQAGASIAHTKAESDTDTVNTGLTFGDGMSVSDAVTTSISERQSETAQTQNSNASSVSNTDGTSESLTDTKATNRSSQLSSSDYASLVTNSQVTTGAVNGMMVANNIADKGLADDLQRSMMDAGVGGHIDQWMYENREELETAFGYGRDDEQYAFAAMYVAQGVGGNVPGFSDEQQDVLRAISGDYVAAATFGWKQDPDSNVDTSGIGEFDDRGFDYGAKSAELAEKYGMSTGQFWENFQDNQPASQFVAQFGEYASGMFGRLDNMSDGQATAMFSEARGRLDSDYNEMMSADDLHARIAEDGHWGTIIDTVNPFKGEEATDDRAMKAMFRDEFNDGIFAGEVNGDQSIGQQADGILQQRLSTLEGMDGFDPHTPTGQYMALAQLERGAELAGEGDYAAYFNHQMSELEQQHPGLAGEHGDRIQAIAYDSVTENGMDARYDLARAEYQFGETKAQFGADTGLNFNDAGVGADWYSSSMTGETPISYSPRDLDIAARTMIGEAAGEGSEGLAAVAHVLKNRVEDDRWGNSPSEVALEHKQFSAWNTGAGGNHLTDKYGPGDAAYDRAYNIAESVFSGQHSDPTGEATHYYSPAGMQALVDRGEQSNLIPRWLDEENDRRDGAPTRIGGHIFSGAKKSHDA